MRQHWTQSRTQSMATIVLAVTNERPTKKTRSAPTPARARLPGKYYRGFAPSCPAKPGVLAA